MDGVSGLEAGAKSIFPDIVVQRYIVYLIRNSIKYVLSKEYKNIRNQLKEYMVYHHWNQPKVHLIHSLISEINILKQYNQLIIDDRLKNRIDKYIKY